jgi:putative redox protein
MTNHITTQWKGGLAFETTNASGLTFRIDARREDGGEGKGMRPKSLMLSALAGCSGIDVANLIKKMKLDVRDFRIDILAQLTDDHPKYYHSVIVEYHFYGKDLPEEKLIKAVNLSVEKYCGVMEMFRQFAKMEIRTLFHND